MVANRAKRRRSVSKSAIASVRSGIISKSTLFVIAGIAFFFLTRLDGTKTRYDIRNDNNNASAISVDDQFLDALAIPDPTEINHWLFNPGYFKYHQFDSQKAFINALSARSSAEYANASAALEAEKRSLAKQTELAQFELENIPLRKASREKKQKEIDLLAQAYAARDGELINLRETFSAQSTFIHGELGKKLPQTMLTLGRHSPGLSDSLFYPILNEKSSLNVVFQVLRMTALVIIVLTFIFIVVMCFQMLPLASGATTASDQLRSLISLKSVAAGSEIAKVAIIGVTAVGIGTAVVVGGHALEGAGSSMVLNRYLPAESVDYKPSFTIEPPESEVDHPIEFKPNINVPQPLVLDQRTIVPGDTRKVLEQLEVLVKALPTAQAVADLKARIDILQNQKNTICDCLSVLPQSKTDIYLLPTPTPTPTPTQSPSQSSSSSLATLIAELQVELQKANDEQIRRAPDDRNILNRTGDFISGGEYFAVSEHSLESLKTALKPVILDQKLEQALKDLMTLPPQRKSQFLSTLRMRVKRNADAGDALEQLSRYERKILTKFKLSN